MEQMLPLCLCPLSAFPAFASGILSVCAWGLEAEGRTGPSNQGAVGEQELTDASDFSRIRTP